MESENFRIAVGLLDTNKFDKAITFFTKVVEAEPDNSQAYNLRGITKFKLFDLEGAIKDITKALQLNNQNHEAWFNKGEIFRYKKQFADAEFFLKTANEIYPGSLNYLTGLIRVTYAEKKYDCCIEYCNEILKDRAYDNIALSYRALCYSKQLRYLPAIQDYKILIQNGYADETTYSNIGYWYSKIGEFKKAYNNLSIALEYNTTHPYALNNLGYVLYMQRNFKRALELVNQSLDIDPSNSYAYKNRAIIYLKTEQNSLAHADLLRSKELGYLEDYGKEVEDLLHKYFLSS